MRVAYADPPYPGRHSYYKEGQPVDYGEIFERLATFDGWALSTSSSSLAELLRLIPANVGGKRTTHRVAAWCRTDAAPLPGRTLWMSWEPVIYCAARDPRTRTRDFLVGSRRGGRKGLIGSKPCDFYTWLFELVGFRDGDGWEELFPGTGLGADMAGQRWLL